MLVSDKINSQYLGEERELKIYLSQDYQKGKRYPVLYMQDGQNLFEEEFAYKGQSWLVHKTMELLEKEKIIKGMIVVGIYNSPTRRYSEYSPWEMSADCPPKFEDNEKRGGFGEEYGYFITQELKPYIDENYHTKEDFENTFIAGSSMGAYISAYIAAQYSEIFSKAGIFSLASWFNEEEFLNFINDAPVNGAQGYYISVGTEETSSDKVPNFNQIYLDCTARYKEIIETKTGNVEYLINQGHTHSEECWQSLFANFVMWCTEEY